MKREREGDEHLDPLDVVNLYLIRRAIERLSTRGFEHRISDRQARVLVQWSSRCVQYPLMRRHKLFDRDGALEPRRQEL